MRRVEGVGTWGDSYLYKHGSGGACFIQAVWHGGGRAEDTHPARTFSCERRSRSAGSAAAPCCEGGTAPSPRCRSGSPPRGSSRPERSRWVELPLSDAGPRHIQKFRRVPIVEQESSAREQCRRPGPVRVLRMTGRAPPPARITRTGPLGAQEAVSAVSSVTTTCGSGGHRWGSCVLLYSPQGHPQGTPGPRDRRSAVWSLGGL